MTTRVRVNLDIAWGDSTHYGRNGDKSTMTSNQGGGAGPRSQHSLLGKPIDIYPNEPESNGVGLPWIAGDRDLAYPTIPSMNPGRVSERAHTVENKRLEAMRVRLRNTLISTLKHEAPRTLLHQ